MRITVENNGSFVYVMGSDKPVGMAPGPKVIVIEFDCGMVVEKMHNDSYWLVKIKGSDIDRMEDSTGVRRPEQNRFIDTDQLLQMLPQEDAEELIYNLDILLKI